jgi:sigma-54-interacting transcriptional regulator
MPLNTTVVPARSTDGAGFRFRPSEDDWAILREAQPNVLLSGPPDATHSFLLAVTPYLQEPVRCGVAADALLSLPAADGALILRDVDTLDREQQLQLLRWLDDPRNCRTQVISITAAPLYPAVRTGTFLDRLYYRLNVTHFEVISD